MKKLIVVFEAIAIMASAVVAVLELWKGLNESLQIEEIANEEKR